MLSEIRDYGKLKRLWGHGHIYLSFGSWKPLGSYVYIAAYYKGQNWWLGVDNTLEEALINLSDRQASGEYKVWSFFSVTELLGQVTPWNSRVYTPIDLRSVPPRL